jgi:uncharacterized protein YukE
MSIVQATANTIRGMVMGDLRGISEDVPFAFAAAADLAAELRASATACETQVPRRTAVAGTAEAEWRGRYAREFAGRMRICTTDAQRLATAMRDAANQVDELARLAREEQNRREQAREWQRRQDEESVLDKIGDFVFGEDDLPPIPDPVTPPSFTTPAPVSASRG